MSYKRYRTSSVNLGCYLFYFVVPHQSAEGDLPYTLPFRLYGNTCRRKPTQFQKEKRKVKRTINQFEHLSKMSEILSVVKLFRREWGEDIELFSAGAYNRELRTRQKEELDFIVDGITIVYENSLLGYFFPSLLRGNIFIQFSRIRSIYPRKEIRKNHKQKYELFCSINETFCAVNNFTYINKNIMKFQYS